MDRLYLSAREIAAAVSLLAFVVVGFGILGYFTGYPKGNEWQAAIYIALAVAAVPILFRILYFLQQTRSVLDIKGIKIDFGKTAATPAVRLTENVVDPGHQVTESGMLEVLNATRDANRSAAVVVDLKTGKAWYKTRLYALACAGLEFGHPRVIVFLAALSGLPASFLGYVHAERLARTMMKEKAYRDAYNSAKVKYNQLSAFANSSLNPPNFQLNPNVQVAAQFFEGRPSFIALLIAELHPLEQPIGPWINASDMQELLGDDLHSDTIEERNNDQKAILRFLSGGAEYIALVQGRRFLGLVPAERVMREIIVTVAS
jgi:hypothetical protein